MASSSKEVTLLLTGKNASALQSIKEVEAQATKSATGVSGAFEKSTQKTGSLFKTLDSQLANFGVPFTGALSKAGGDLEKFSNEGSTGVQKFGSFASTAFDAAALGAAFVGAAGIKMADDFEAAHARLETAITNTGGNFDELKGKVGATDQSLEHLGFTNTDTESALASLTAATGNAQSAMGLMGLAADIARGRHTDLATAVGILVKVETGHVSLLGRLGIATKDATGKTISQEEAVKRLTDLYGGQASAYAETFSGKLQVLKASGEDLGKNIGVALIPVIEDLVGAINTGVKDFEAFNGALDGIPGKMAAFTAGALLLYGAGVKVVAVGQSIVGAFTSLIGAKATEAGAEAADTAAVDANTAALEENAAAAGTAAAGSGAAAAGTAATGAAAAASGASISSVFLPALAGMAEGYGNLKLDKVIGQQDLFHASVDTAAQSVANSIPGGEVLTATLGFLGVGSHKAAQSQSDLAQNTQQVAEQNAAAAQTSAEAATEIQAQTKAIDDLYNAQNAFLDSGLALDRANNTVAQGFVTYTKALKDNAPNSQAVTTATLDMKGQILAAGEAAFKSASDHVKLTEAQQGVTDTGQAATAGHQAELKELQALGAFFPGLDGIIQGYIKTLGGVPPTVTTTMSIDDAQAVQQIQYYSSLMNNLPTNKQTSIITFGNPTGHAAGGPVTAGAPYIVGEKGPELFVPSSSGNIVPNDKLGGSASSIGSPAQQPIYVVVNVDDSGRATVKALQNYNRVHGPAPVKVTAG